MLRDAIIRDQKARVSNKALHEARHARCQRRFPVAVQWIETCTGSISARVGRIEANPRPSGNEQGDNGSMRRLSHLLHRDIMSPCPPIELERLDATPAAQESALNRRSRRGAGADLV